MGGQGAQLDDAVTAMSDTPAAALSSGVRALVAGYHRRVWRVQDVLAAVAGRLGTVDPSIGAFTATDMDRAEADARALDERLERRPAALPPLFGVPVAVKETIDVAGLPTSLGLEARRGRRPDRDAEVVARLRAAGAVVVGATRSPALAWSLSTDGPLTVGRTANPRYPDRVAGGSSGGSAAAVASGIVPVALGTDTGGSIRLPAGWCGVMGLRPSRGLVPVGGVLPLSSSLDVVGPIATTAADLGLVLSVLSGRAPGEVSASGAHTPVGFCVDGLEAGSAVLEGMEHLRSVLGAGGLHTPTVPLPLADDETVDAYATIQLHEAWLLHRADRTLLDVAPDDVPPGVRRRWERGAALDAETVADARARVEQLGARMRAQLRDVPVVVSPVAATPPPLVAPRGGRPAGDVTRAVLPHTVVQNLLGLPACAFAVPTPDADPPTLALQVTGPPGQDAAVLGVVATIIRHVSAA